MKKSIKETVREAIEPTVTSTLAAPATIISTSAALSAAYSCIWIARRLIRFVKALASQALPLRRGRCFPANVRNVAREVDDDE